MSASGSGDEMGERCPAEPGWAASWSAGSSAVRALAVGPLNVDGCIFLPKLTSSSSAYSLSSFGIGVCKSDLPPADDPSKS